MPCDGYAPTLERLLARIEETAAAAPPAAGFPHFADPVTGEWTRSPAGDWTGGFFVGELWLAARITGDRRLLIFAREWSAALRPRLVSATVFRGFLFWYGAKLGSILLEDDDAERLALDGARHLDSSFNRAVGLIPLGEEGEEAHSVGDGEANIDGVPGTTPLLVRAATPLDAPMLAEHGLDHARRHAEFLVRADGSVCQSASFDPATGELRRLYTHKGLRDDSTWTRAQAWAMLGLTQAAALDSSLLPVAERVSDWWLARAPADGVAYWDFDAPPRESTRRDTSGTAIAAASLLKLAGLGSGGCERYRDAAVAMVDALLSRHLLPADPASSRTPARLVDGCYNHRIGLATEHELIWGDYFLMEALAALHGSVDTTRF